MCGRFAFYSPAEAMTRVFGVEDPPRIEPRYNIAPTQYVPIVRADEDDVRSVAMLRWGLIPFWAKDKSIGARTINARAETVASKPSFRDAFKKRRCLVPANGFYEWQKQGAAKQPYFINLGGDEPFAMAGLWSSWRNPQDPEESLESFTIITTSPSEKIASVHNRMPVILEPQHFQRWLAPTNQDADDLTSLLVAFDSPALQYWPVSRMVNNARNEQANLVEPVTG